MRGAPKEDEVQWEGEEDILEREVGGDDEEEKEKAAKDEGCLNISRIAGQVRPTRCQEVIIVSFRMKLLWIINI